MDSENTSFYSTGYVASLLNKKPGTILAWARQSNLRHEGTGSGIRYLWTEEDIERYKEYAKNTKLGRKTAPKLEETTNFDTLYHRLARCKKNGNKEQYEQTRQLLDELKKKKNQEVSK